MDRPFTTSLQRNGFRGANETNEFFSNDLPLSAESQACFGGPLYRDLRSTISDAFDDFEIDFDVIEDATDEELKDFFQRLQEGMGLNSSEKLNAVHSKLRDHCKKLAKHKFFAEIIAIPDTRYAHFDIAAKVATIEIEGPDTGLRLDDVKAVFQSNNNFSSRSVSGIARSPTDSCVVARGEEHFATVRGAWQRLVPTGLELDFS